MAIRSVKDAVPTPPPGAVTLAVARHLTPGSSDPRIVEYHRARAKAIHDLVDACGADVRNWGMTDAEHPSEVVDLEIVMPIATTAITAAATVLAAWVSVRSGRKKSLEPAQTPVHGFAMRASDGSRIDFTYRDQAEFDHVVASVTRIAEAVAKSGPARKPRRRATV